ncbi:MAG: hypothetical protein AB1791_04295 [Chloroflexota bacterium]
MFHYDEPPALTRKQRWKLLVWPLGLALLALACTGSGTNPPAATPYFPTPTATPQLFSDGTFSLPLPNWPAVETSDPNTLITVTDGGRAVAIARHAALPRSLGRHLLRILPDYGFSEPTLDERGPAEVRLDASIPGSTPQRARLVALYCRGASYLVTGSSPAAAFSDFEPFFEQLLNQATCQDSPTPDPAGPGMIGLFANPANDDFSLANWRAALRAARAAGAQATHLYLAWDQVETAPGEYDWGIADHLLDLPWLEGLRLSLVIEFIHTSVIGPRPADLNGLDLSDPRLVERAAAFAAAVAERYGDQLDYLALGNEVNIYLADDPQKLDTFLAFLDTVRAAVRRARPDLPTGTVLAFHELQNSGRLALIDAFKDNDFLAYTYYPHGPGFAYDGDPNGFGQVLEQMITLSGQTPFLVVENGWATAATLGGSEERQAAYIQATFAALQEHRQAFQRHVWFGLHDGLPENCAKSALSFVEAGFDPATAGDFWPRFQDYLCTLGLRYRDGASKQGWAAFQTGVR